MRQYSQQKHGARCIHHLVKIGDWQDKMLQMENQQYGYHSQWLT